MFVLVYLKYLPHILYGRCINENRQMEVNKMYCNTAACGWRGKSAVGRGNGSICIRGETTPVPARLAISGGVVYTLYTYGNSLLSCNNLGRLAKAY